MARFSEVASYVDLDFSRGKPISSIDQVPGTTLIVTSTCRGISLSPREQESSIILWDAVSQIYPVLLLKSPVDCPVVRVNPSQPNFVIGGGTSGQVILWDDHARFGRPMETYGVAIGQRSQKLTLLDGASDETGLHQSRDRKCHTQPLAMSSPDQSHKQMVGDVCWLPPHIQVNSKGRLLSPEHLDGKSNQFISVSSDGSILFWDIRVQQIATGNLCHVMRPNTTKPGDQNFGKPHEFDHYIAKTKWVPIYKLRAKRFESSNIIPFSKAFIQTSDHNSSPQCNIICTSESGDVVCVSWLPKEVDSVSEGGRPRTAPDESVNECVQWIRSTSCRPVAIDASPFFNDIFVVVSKQKFDIWNASSASEHPVFTGELDTFDVSFTGGCWHLTRPGVLVLSQSNGSIDVWDFLDNVFKPVQTVTISPHGIHSMKFVAHCICEENSEDSPSKSPVHLAVGDGKGFTKIIELQWDNMMHDGELDTMRSFLYRNDSSRKIAGKQEDYLTTEQLLTNI